MIRLVSTAIAGLVLSASAAFADWKPLVAPADLAEMLDEEPVVLDIRSPGAYAEGHIETAVSVPYNAWRGPEDNPGALISDEKLTAILTEAGVEPDVPVIITYAGKGTLDFGSAARVYWTLKSAGVEEIAILNGGLNAWTAAGLELTTEAGGNFASDVTYSFAETWLIDREGVRDVLDGTATAQLVDARPEAFFTGVKKHDAAAWPGTLSGALNIVHETWFGGPVLAATKSDMLAALKEAGVDPTAGDIVSFCNTGHWAATNWFVLSEIAGIEGVRLYPESMVGWTQNAERVAGLVQ
ncbi:MAG: rhodanese-like domain-containing protein [Pseudomonadota bacterium]